MSKNLLTLSLKTFLAAVFLLMTAGPVWAADIALFILIDKSGSMGTNQGIQDAKTYAAAMINALQPSDVLGLAGFDFAPFLAAKPELVKKNRNTALKRLDFFIPVSQSNFHSGLALAEQELQPFCSLAKEVIVITDGNLHGLNDELLNYTKKLQTKNIRISIIETGEIKNETRLAAIAKKGGGFHLKKGFTTADLTQALAGTRNKNTKSSCAGQ